MNVPHWKNWIECIRTREKPTSEIETCVVLRRLPSGEPVDAAQDAARLG